MDDYRDTESCLGSTRGTNWFPLRSFLPHRGSEQTRVEWLFDDVRPGSPYRVVLASRREGQSDLWIAVPRIKWVHQLARLSL